MDSSSSSFKYQTSKYARSNNPYFESSSDKSNNYPILASVCEGARASGTLDTATLSVPRTYINRDREAAERLLIEHNFNPDLVYGYDQFRRRFCMSRNLFNRIVEDMEREFPSFQTTYDGTGARSFSSLQKCTSAMLQIALGNMPDALDEYLAMSERTSRESLQEFCYGIIKLHSTEYMRKPTTNDIQLLYAAHEAKHGFPGMLGSIDCTHWNWRTCLTEFRGQYMRGDHKYPTIILEAVASQDLWIQHSFFGSAGGNNDLNVLYQSPLFDGQMLGIAPKCPFQLLGQEYKHGYYLADEIYSSCATFVKSVSYPVTDKKKRFKAA